MHKIDCKRGYKRYMDFNHNRFTLMVKEWYHCRIVDIYYNEKFLGYTTTEATWADLFNSDSSDKFIANLIKENDKLKDYADIFEGMNLSEENLMFQDNQFRLYVTVPYHQKAILKICKLSDSEKKKVLQQCILDAYVFEEIYNSCTEYLEGLDEVLMKINGIENP